MHNDSHVFSSGLAPFISLAAWNRLAFLAFFVSALLPQRATAASDRSPNIVFILADDLGYGDLGCYGQREIQTPNIDRIAAQGTRFTQVCAGAPVCAPARCVLLTGLHTGHCRVRENHGRREVVPPAEHGQKNRIPLEPNDITVAELLKTAGYATAVFGKWGLGEPGSTGVPTRQGFDEWFGFLNQDHADDYYTDHLWKNEEVYVVAGNEKGRRNLYVHDLFTERALNFIRDHRAEPFFLYLAYTIPHKNYEVPSTQTYEPKPWSDFEKIYASMVSRLDADVGRVLDLLHQLQLDEETILFFTSDNGAPASAADSQFQSSLQLRGRKGSLYEGGIRVPMIVRWPGRVPAGEKRDDIWYFADFLPTAADLAGLKPPLNVDGISVLPALLGGTPVSTDRYLYWEAPKTQAARRGNWKVIRPRSGQFLELFDLGNDPAETKNLASAHPEIIAEFENYFKTSRTPSPYYSNDF